MTTDHRLIEDYIPTEAISAEARREKSIRKGHILPGPDPPRRGAAAARRPDAGRQRQRWRPIAGCSTGTEGHSAAQAHHQLARAR
jgi:hypothetical protein